MPTASEIHVRGSGIRKHIKKQRRPIKENHDLGSNEGGTTAQVQLGTETNACKETCGCLEKLSSLLGHTAMDKTSPSGQDLFRRHWVCSSTRRLT